jgi:hypothetical protein
MMQKTPNLLKSPAKYENAAIELASEICTGGLFEFLPDRGQAVACASERHLPGAMGLRVD